MFRPLFNAALLVAGWVIAAHAGEPHPSLPPPVIPDCLGVNIHFTDPQPCELEMLAAAGFKWVRVDFGWEATEKKKGEYDFSAYDRLVAALDKFKIRAVFILDYGNPLYADPGDVPYFTSRANTPEFRQAFGKWAVAAVSHFKGRGYLWDMWNEPNGGFWKSPDKTGDYIALAKSTGEALRQAGLLGPKGEAFIGPATSLIDLPYLEACFKAGLLDYWDAVSVHPYRQGAPETVEEEYRTLRLLIRKYAPKDKVIPIISGEWGYSSAWEGMGKDEAARAEQQAKYLPRELLANIANDVALSIWYDWHEDGTDPKEGEHHFGIVGHEYHAGRDPVYDPKPAYTAMKTLSEQLGGFRFNKQLVFGFPAYYPLLFTRAQETRVAFWGNSRSPYEDWIPASPGEFQGVSYDGRTVPNVVVKDLQTPNFRITKAPRYFAPSELNDVLRLAAGWKRLPLELVCDPEKNTDWESVFRNPLDHSVEAELAGTKRILEAGREVTVRLTSEPTRFEKMQAEYDLVVKSAALPKGLAVFHQQTTLISVAPLRFRLLAPNEVGVPVQVENPQGEPFDGVVRLLRENDTEDDAPDGEIGNAKLDLKRGEKERIVLIEASKKEWSNGGVYPVIRKPDGSWLASGSVELLRPMPGFSPSGGFVENFHVWADGDAKVNSKQVMTETRPMDGPPALRGAPAMKLTYGFDGGWRFILVSPTHAQMLERAIHPRTWEFVQKVSQDGSIGFIPRDPKELRMWLRGDGKGCAVRVRFTDSTGQTFQPDGPKIDWTGWRYISFPMQSTEEKPLSHWGGANDGVIHYPIKWDSIFLLDNVSRQPVEGEIYLSAPTLIY